MRVFFLLPVLAGLALSAQNSLDPALNLYQRTDYKGAIAALKGLPEDARALELLGQCYFMEAEFRKATDALEKAASLDPKSSSIQTWLGRAYGRRAETSFALPAIGYATKARQALERAVQLDGRNMEAINDLFEYYLEAPAIMGGGYDKAKGLISLIAKNDPV